MVQLISELKEEAGWRRRSETEHRSQLNKWQYKSYQNGDNEHNYDDNDDAPFTRMTPTPEAQKYEIHTGSLHK